MPRKSEWTTTEIEKMVNQYNAGKRVRDIAKQFKITPQRFYNLKYKLDREAGTAITRTIATNSKTKQTKDAGFSFTKTPNDFGLLIIPKNKVNAVLKVLRA